MTLFARKESQIENTSEEQGITIGKEKKSKKRNEEIKKKKAVFKSINPNELEKDNSFDGQLNIK